MNFQENTWTFFLLGSNIIWMIFALLAPYPEFCRDGPDGGQLTETCSQEENRIYCFWLKPETILLSLTWTDTDVLSTCIKKWIVINTGLFISPWNISEIHNKYTTQRIMVVLTLMKRETLQVFFFTYFTDVQCVHLW